MVAPKTFCVLCFYLQIMEALDETTAAVAHLLFFYKMDSWLPSWAIQLLFPFVCAATRKGLVKINHFFSKQIEEHRRTLDPDHPRDVMDVYIKERKGEDFTGHRFACTMTVFCFDGIGTLGYVLQWTLLLLASKPGTVTSCLIRKKVTPVSTSASGKGTRHNNLPLNSKK